MTKTEYAEYLQSEHWQNFRKKILGDRPCCEKCGVPRWLAEALYSQDFHVHHLHYESLGCETPADVRVLCRRCHQLEKFPFSQLPKLETRVCHGCGNTYFNPYNPICDTCETIFGTQYLLQNSSQNHSVWKLVLAQMAHAVSESGVSRDLFLRWAGDVYDGVIEEETKKKYAAVFA